MKKVILPAELEIAFNPSRFLWGWWLIFSMLNLACALWGVLSVLPTLTTVQSYGAWAVFMAFIACYGIASHWHYRQLLGGRWPHSVNALRIDVYGRCWLQQNQGDIRAVEILTDSVVYRYLICLHVRYLPDEDNAATTTVGAIYKRQLRTQWLLILPDMLPTSQMRALQLWLRWGRLNPAANNSGPI